MAYTTINKGSDYFISHLYSGNDTTNNQSVGLTPDLVWVKCRNVGSPTQHYIADKIRGNEKYISSNATTAEQTDGNTFELVSGGFNLDGGNGWTNLTGRNYVAWNWLAGGTGVSNTDGNITSTVSASTTSGFSIVKWTGTGTGQSNVTIGHGLNATPKVIIFKQLDTGGWIVYHEVLGSNNFLTLNATDASTSATGICNPNSTNIVLPTSYIGTNSTAGMIAYCFAEKKGFSKFGSYVGNGSTDGTFVYTGFKPAFVMVKKYNATEDWFMYDNKRGGFNPDNFRLKANDLASEDPLSTGQIDLLSNGWKFRNSGTQYNASGDSYIFMAFAENPLVSSTGTPVTAR